MAKYLITGGAGFIGSHLAESLLADGHKVVVLDDLSSGRRENLAGIENHPNFSFTRDAVITCPSLKDMVDDSDIVFHLAATVGVLNIVRSPVETIENNIDGTQAVLKAAAEKKVKIVVASTSEVYGKSVSTPFGEDDDLVLGSTSKARWSYAASKIIDEFLALACWREQQIPTVVVRLFNTIGPRQIGQYGMVVPRLLNQALKGENLTVYGTGAQSRSFTYVGDIVQWLRLLAVNDAAIGQVFNLGNPREFSILELAEMILKLTGSKSQIEHVPYHVAYESGFEDIGRRVPNISRVVRMTGYEPRVHLEESLIRTREWLLSSGPAC
jgi:UDP-glucose 4-epimerase